MIYPINEQVSRLKSELDNLPNNLISVFFLFCAERLFPLYEEFSRKTGWGNLTYLRNLLDSLWEEGQAQNIMNYSRESDEVNKQIPHIDEFDNLEATFAQDFCICMDAALLALSGSTDTSLIEYVFEPVRIAVCLQKYGVLDVGSEKEKEFEEYLGKAELMKSEIKYQQNAIDLLSRTDGVDNSFLDALKKTAINSRLSPIILTAG